MPLGKQFRQSAETSSYHLLPYFLQATPSWKIRPSVLVIGKLCASTPWVSTPTENFGSMLSCSCCRWPPWDRDTWSRQIHGPFVHFGGQLFFLLGTSLQIWKTSWEFYKTSPLDFQGQKRTAHSQIWQRNICQKKTAKVAKSLGYS